MAPYSISKAMLMTAGLGTRLLPFTAHRSKVLLPVMGIPMAQFAVDTLSCSGVTTLVANVHHDLERTSKGLLALDSGMTEIVISDESNQLLGSAGGIRHAIHHFGKEPFFLANADVLCDIDWLALASCHRRLRAQWGVNLTLTIFPQGPAGALYREILLDGQAGLIRGLGDQKEGCPYFVGAAVLEPEACFEVPVEGPSQFVETILIPAIRKRKAGVFLASGFWHDTGSPLLWHQTHLSLMNRLEVGHFMSRTSRPWLKRLQNVNRRLSEKVWTSRRSSRGPKTTGRLAPCYWDEGAEEEVKDRFSVPVTLGPSAILYGTVPGQQILERGIGICGQWVNV